MMGIQVKGTYPDMGPVIYYKGGWENAEVIGSFVPGYASGTGSQDKRADAFHCHVDNEGQRTYVTERPVTLKYIKTLVIRWSQKYGENPHYPRFVVSTSKTGKHSDNTRCVGGSTRFGTREDTMDVSDLQGEYYIRVHEVGVAANNRKGRVYVYEIRGERK